jgi:hypothetical protein
MVYSVMPKLENPTYVCIAMLCRNNIDPFDEPECEAY